MRAKALYYGYFVLSALIRPFLIFLLRRRIKAGKEDPKRWREKLGHASKRRPDAPLIWCHAVGLGEVLALRGLIALLLRQRADWRFLITSGTKASADVLKENMPPNTRHQYLPFDMPGAVRRFQNHWKPDLSIWSEQEIWPNHVSFAKRKGTKLALVSARFTKASFTRRRKIKHFYAWLLRKFDWISAQDPATQRYLQEFDCEVEIDGGFKSLAPPLWVDEEILQELREAYHGSRVFLLASSHREDEEIFFEVVARLQSSDPDMRFVIVPRDPKRGREIHHHAARRGVDTLDFVSQARADRRVAIDARFGVLGLWYRLADVAMIGGSFGPVEGHNPWEAVALNCPIVHGPRVENFRADYRMLRGSDLVRSVKTADDIMESLSEFFIKSGAAGRAEIPLRLSKAQENVVTALIALIENPA